MAVSISDTSFTYRKRILPEVAPATEPAIARLNARTISTLLWSVLAVIVVLATARELYVGYYGTGTALKDLRHFALDSERSLPSWYENLSMAAAAMLLGLIALLARDNDRQNRLHWSALAILFLFLSVDAAVSFHEITVKPLRNGFGLDGIFYYSWVILAAPLTLGVALACIPFLLRIPRRTAAGMFLAGAIFVGGALGTELICGYLASSSGLETPQYKAVAALQEIMEATGLTLFNVTLLGHLAASRTGLVFFRQ